MPEKPDRSRLDAIRAVPLMAALLVLATATLPAHAVAYLSDVCPGATPASDTRITPGPTDASAERSPDACPSPSPSSSDSPSPTPSPAAPSAPTAAVIGSLPGTTYPFTLSAASMTVGGFAYVGNVTVTTPSGAALAMRFTMTTADISRFSALTPCSQHAQWNPSVASSAAAPAGLVLDALEFRGTVGGEAVDWTAVETSTTTVPPAEPIPGGAGTIGGPVTATLARLAAPSLAMPGMSEMVRSC